MAPLALGTDTGGSIRQPAALCGVVGMKPTYGAVSRYGAVAFASSLDQIGPFARTVRDCALALRVIAGPDICDSTCLGPPEPIELPEREDLRGAARGRDLAGRHRRRRARRARELRGRARDGARARRRARRGQLEFSLTPHALAAYYLIAPAEASANLARYDGVRYGLRVPGDDVFEMYDATRQRGFGREVKRRCLIGAYALSAGYYDAYYGQAQRVRTLIRRDFDQAFESCDLLLTPTSPTVAFRIGELVDDPLAMYACDLFTLPVNLSGLPAISLPCGLSEGLPVGLHLAGPAFSENRLLAAAHALEGALRVRSAPAGAAGCGMSVPGGLGGRDRPRDPRAALDAQQDVLPLPERVRAASPTRASARSARRSPVRCRSPTARPWSARSPSGSRWSRRSRAHSTFHRKNYFYPDSPKAYQISQYDEPLCNGGRLAVPTADGDDIVGFERVHLEEDAAKTVHEGGGGGRLAGSHGAVVDFNRCGTPLMEMVTLPDLRTPEQASRFASFLRETIVALGVSECDMEKGSLRVDANVSLRRPGEDELRTKTELKNMNSFSYLERGIARELRRQAELYEAGEDVVTVTLHYDPASDELTVLRSKELAHDYRYFPEPDLVPIEPSAELIDELRAALPELPAARVRRFERDYALPLAQALDLGLDSELAGYFEEVAAASGDAPRGRQLGAQRVLGAPQRVAPDAPPSRPSGRPRWRR